jgi:pimeloyl-ACP methyl ester carboxylesterase
VTEFRKVALSTGVTLNIALAGSPEAPPVILLHGFPESHRTWRGLAPLLEDEFRLVMPDQRGFAGSDRPRDVEAYKTDILVDDIFALAEALGIERFALVGHDWGGAISWAAALRGDPRLTRLAVINAPHPVIFQKSLIQDSDQRGASQYITAFRAPGFEAAVAAMGWEAFFAKSFGGHVDLAIIPPQERAQYIADWSEPGGFTAMLNWYRAAQVIVPPPGIEVPIPDFLLRAFPKLPVPVLVIWGMQDKALLPLQLDGLDALVPDLRIARIADAGHFVPWEKPEAVAAALEPFIAAAHGA